MSKQFAAAVQPGRIQQLNAQPVRLPARYVLYWMQNAQRSRFNPALEFAMAHANEIGLPLLVGFGLTEAYPEANARHYGFLLQDLADVRAAFAKRGIAFANVGWIFGLHDRPWGERPVFGTVRSMTANSLRKFDTGAYMRMVDALTT